MREGRVVSVWTMEVEVSGKAAAMLVMAGARERMEVRAKEGERTVIRFFSSIASSLPAGRQV